MTTMTSTKATGIELYDHQIKAVNELKNGSILCGGVGSGKSRTALAYYIKACGGSLRINGEGKWGAMTSPRPLFIITTAKKRDSLEWKVECIPFYIKEVTIDSWNNIKRYENKFGAFFIFDEQRVVGKGAWVKAFLKITKKNKWILLSATPGDTWSDYIPVFTANGFIKNKTEFYNNYCVFNPHTKYPKIERYINTGYLVKCRREILVNMDFKRNTHPVHRSIIANYDKALYLKVFRERWDPFDDCPITETGKLCYLMRKVVNMDKSRAEEVRGLIKIHKKAIIFYNYDYELEILRRVGEEEGVIVKEWNGKNHDEVPSGGSWIYLVQYAAGCEGWNCVTTDTIIFYSQSYSYRMSVQAAGRIDRLNTPFTDLYYYHIKSMAPIDLAIARALSNKRNFNERAFLGI